MNFIFGNVVGGALGWIAAFMIKSDAKQGRFLSIVAGVIAALLAAWLFSPIVGVGNINSSDFSLRSLLASSVWATILLAIVNLVNRGGALTFRAPTLIAGWVLCLHGDVRFRASPYVPLVSPVSGLPPLSSNRRMIAHANLYFPTLIPGDSCVY